MEEGVILKAVGVITEGLTILPDDVKAEWKTQAGEGFIDDAIKAALKVVEEDESDLSAEKHCMLAAYAVQEANRMASTLWRLEILPKDLEEKYRALPTMTEIVKPYNEFLSKRKEREDELNEPIKTLQEEKRELDIFMGIINGVPVEESERRYDEFKNAQRQALAGGR